MKKHIQPPQNIEEEVVYLRYCVKFADKAIIEWQDACRVLISLNKDLMKQIKKGTP